MWGPAPRHSDAIWHVFGLFWILYASRYGQLLMACGLAFSSVHVSVHNASKQIRHPWCMHPPGLDGIL